MNTFNVIEGNSLMPISPLIIPHTQILGVLTMYNPVPWQTDDTPEITASGEFVKEGMIANNCLEFGTWVEIDGVFYRVSDRMNSRYDCQYYDILSFDLEEAIEFGVQKKEVIIYK